MEENTSLVTIAQAVEVIKTAILQSQAHAARGVNANELALYFAIGGYISTETRKQKWGSGAIEAISERLRKELPGLKGFGASSIRNMRQFYEEWHDVIIQQPVAGKLASTEIQQPMAGEMQTNLPTQLILTPTRLDFSRDVFDVEMAYNFISIGFSHHMEILFKTDDLEQRLFYIRQAALNKWNKYALRDYLKEDLFHHQSAMPNNFLATMPKSVQALKAIEMFKDEYLLDYINVEELGARDAADVDENVVEQAIVHNVKNFIMTFGTDFTFVGNQYFMEKFGHEMFSDLLFYNRELAALVVVELKKGEFKPAYLGQLSGYLRVLDAEVKKPFENPSIGIILCKSADKSFVEFLIQGYNNPMGVATYRSQEDIKRLLPPEEELLKLLD